MDWQSMPSHHHNSVNSISIKTQNVDTISLNLQKKKKKFPNWTLSKINHNNTVKFWVNKTRKKRYKSAQSHGPFSYSSYMCERGVPMSPHPKRKEQEFVRYSWLKWGKRIMEKGKSLSLFHQHKWVTSGSSPKAGSTVLPCKTKAGIIKNKMILCM